MKITYLKKANDDVISFCSCEDNLMAYPAQADCPWCGCGWLFSCRTCRKAYTFAEGVEIESSWEDLARQDLSNYSGEEPGEEEIDHWVTWMKHILADVRTGERYVIIDGTVIPTSATDIKFDGWDARHEFAVLPQVRALKDKSALDEQLSQPSYWYSHAHPKDER